MKKRRLLSVLLAAMIVVMGVAGCGKSTTAVSDEKTSTEAKTEEKVLRVGMECGNPPYNWSQTDDSNGAVKVEGTNEYVNGYDITMAKAIAESMGCKLEVYKIEWNGLIMALQSDKIDAIIAGMSPTEERKESVDFTDPYYTAEYLTLVKADGKYADAASKEDLDGAVVSSQQGTKMYDTLSQIPGAKIEEALPDMSSVVVALTSGRIDATIVEKPMGLAAVATNPDLKLLDFEEGYDVDDSITSISIAVRKGDSERLDAMNSKLKEIDESTRAAWMDEAISNQPAEN